MSNYVKQIELSRMAGVSKGNVSILCSKGNKLSPYYDKSIKKIDIDNPEVQFWLKGKQAKNKAKINQLVKEEFKENTVITGDEFDSLTVKEVCEKYGTFEKFHELVKIRKISVETDLKILKLEQSRGDLVPRKEVADVCFSLIDLCFKQILDVPLGALPRLKALIKSDSLDCDEQCKDILYKQISKILSNSKEQINSKLESYDKVKDEDEE